MRLPLMDVSTPKFSLSPQKQSRKPSSSLFGETRQAGLLIIKVFLFGRRRSRLVMGSLIPCPAGMFAWAQPSRTSDDCIRQRSLSLDRLSAGFIRVSTTAPFKDLSLWPALPAEQTGAAWELSSPLISRNLDSRFLSYLFTFLVCAGSLS